MRAKKCVPVIKELFEEKRIGRQTINGGRGGAVRLKSENARKNNLTERE